MGLQSIESAALKYTRNGLCAEKNKGRGLGNRVILGRKLPLLLNGPGTFNYFDKDKR